ncbi:MAG: hypothetical protein Fur002_19670 [Anaerolineales bacterium]
MSETTELAEKLKSEGEKFTAIFSALDAAQWQAKVYADGQTWTLRDVLSHFVTSERSLIKLFESIRQGGAGVSDDFDIDRYNAAQQEKSREFSPVELIEQYQQVRASSIAWVLTLKEEDLERKGRHPFLGDSNLREMVKLLYIHQQTHYRDLRKALKSL